MMKGLSIQTPVDENMSNLTSASGEASFSSSNRNDNGGMYPPQYNFPHINQATKKKRNQPGHPDPDSEVIALSPRSLLATNRFVCEICKKGFQRDQNLQLHKRGHNLPWKLKQRSTTEIVRKKVYVCPEINCVHHDPSRALGDLTGIKKHFCRKHGEKKWKCEKCSKKYAVQSDWKAHSKTCGTREYRCECGTLFSRRDSFITHRAFCDALAEESVKSITGNGISNINSNPILTSQNALSSTSHHINLHQIQSQFNNNTHHDLSFPIKKEQQQFTLIRHEIPPWLPFPPITGPGQDPNHIDLANPSSSSFFQDFQDYFSQNPNPNFTPVGPAYHPSTPPTVASSPHFSATALLQKASQMGSKVATNETHVSAGDGDHISTTGFGLNLSSRDGFFNGLTSYGNKAAAAVIGGNTEAGASAGGPTLLHEMMMMNSHPLSSIGFHQGLAFQDVAFDGILNKKDEVFHANHEQFSSRRIEGGANDNMTRDFLGLRPLYQSDILSISDLARQLQEK